MLRSVALLLLALAAGAVPLSAQTFAQADSLLALQDTSGAIAVLEAMIKHHMKNAEAHYRAGVLYMSRHEMGTALSPNRRKAEEHFRYATRFESDSAKYWLALAELFRTEEVITTRMQVPHLVGRALEEARKHGGDPLGKVAYRAARVEWDRYEQLAHQYLLTPLDAGDNTEVRRLDLDVFMQDWNYVRDFFQQWARPDPGQPGVENLGKAAAALRTALQRNPRSVDAAGLLAVTLGEADRWTDAYVMARELVIAAPDSGRARAVMGLALARLGRWREAKNAYEQAFARMTPEERAPYENLGLIFSMADSVALVNGSAKARTVTDSLYWLANQPLYLHQVNETRIEYFARVTYAIHRWSDPLRGYQGYESDRGAVYVRYGPPDLWATLGQESSSSAGRRAMVNSIAGNQIQNTEFNLDFLRNTVVWVYMPTQLRFAFSLSPGYARAVFSSDHRAWYRVTRDNMPVRFDNVPVVRNLDTIGTQVAQFRGDTAGRTDVVVYAATPSGRMASATSEKDLRLETAAIVKDTTLRDVVRERRQKAVPDGDSLRRDLSTWRLSLAPENYLLRVEAVLNVPNRAARSAAPLHVRRFTSDSLQLSDVIAAERIAPKDSTANHWTDFLIAPSAGRLRPGVPVALLWEIYNLLPDSAGLVDYDVDIRFTVQEMERHGFAARILGFLGDATGLSAEGDDQVTLSFHRRRDASADGRAVEYLDVDLQNAPEASYLVTVTVTDTHTGRTAAVERWLTVSGLPLTR